MTTSQRLLGKRVLVLLGSTAVGLATLFGGGYLPCPG